MEIVFHINIIGLNLETDGCHGNQLTVLAYIAMAKLEWTPEYFTI